MRQSLNNPSTTRAPVPFSKRKKGRRACIKTRQAGKHLRNKDFSKEKNPEKYWNGKKKSENTEAANENTEVHWNKTKEKDGNWRKADKISEIQYSMK